MAGPASTSYAAESCSAHEEPDHKIIARTGFPERRQLNYFTAFYPSAVIPIGKRIDRHLMRWARWKYKRLKPSEDRTRTWLKAVRQRSPRMFAHWTLRYTT
jgi:hypothetical protein